MASNLLSQKASCQHQLTAHILVYTKTLLTWQLYKLVPLEFHFSLTRSEIPWHFPDLEEFVDMWQPWVNSKEGYKMLFLDYAWSHLPSVDRPEVISSVFLAASSLIRNTCTRASIELTCPLWLLSLSSWFSTQGDVCNCTREAMFCLLSSTRLINSSKL